MAEHVEGAPPWCAGVRYAAATNKISLVALVPLADLVRGLQGAGFAVQPMRAIDPSAKVSIALETDAAGAAVVCQMLTRVADESKKIVIDVG